MTPYLWLFETANKSVPAPLAPVNVNAFIFQSRYVLFAG
jgi:hypothetical protein